MTGDATDKLLQYAAQTKPLIDERLDLYWQLGTSCPARLQQAIRHSLLAPGKRLRPLLVLSAAEICGSDIHRAMPAACAVEMVHTYSLIHDDLPAMDNDDLRRGLPTCHVAFDEATAILAGDALLTRAFELLATEVEPAGAAAKCCAELARAAGATRMVGGQADDLAAEKLPGDLKTLEQIHRRKTGAMLISSLRIGAILAGADAEPLTHLTSYASKLGMAFQIVDDLLDLTGTEGTIGKRTGQDARLGKLTFPALLGIDESRQRAAGLIQEAVAELRSFGPQAALLEALAHYVLERNH